MFGRILKTLALALVLGGVFAGSVAAMPVTEPSVYSVSSSSSHVIVSEKVAGLTAVPAAPTIYSDHGVLVPEPKTEVLATSGGSGFDWSDAGVASALTFAALLALSAGALVIRRQHRPLAH
jgi:hypothetical protein